MTEERTREEELEACLREIVARLSTSLWPGAKQLAAYAERVLDGGPGEGAEAASALEA